MRLKCGRNFSAAVPIRLYLLPTLAFADGIGIIRPDTTTFLDSMMRDNSVLRVDEVKIGSTTHYRGKPIESCDVLPSSGVVLVSLRRGINERDFIFNPPPNTVINSGDTLIVIGNPEQLEFLRGKLSK